MFRESTTTLMKFLFVFFLIEVVINCCADSQTSGGSGVASAERGGEYCETEVFRAACADNEVLLLLRARYGRMHFRLRGSPVTPYRSRYGRMRLGRCVEFDLGYIDCYTDVLTRLDKRCSGRRTCEVRIPDAEFEATGPCLKELKTYLEVGYRCVTVETATAQFCASNSYINVSLPTGYINSVPVAPTSSSSSSGSQRDGADVAAADQRRSTVESPAAVYSAGGGCDHSAKPWVIAARRGQRINLTLYDFALDNLHGANVHGTGGTGPGGGGAGTGGKAATQDSGRICRQYGWLDDSAFDRPAPLCATDRRVSVVYSSRGHVVKIWTMAASSSANAAAAAAAGGSSTGESTSVDLAKRFMIKYTVIGCADPVVVPDQTWFERSTDGLTATIGCVNAEVKWSVRCVDNVWVGYHANCTVAHQQRRDDSGHVVDETSIPYGLAIGVGAVIGVFIALIIVSVVGCRRRDVIRGAPGSGNKRHGDHQQLPLRPLDDYGVCYATKVMTSSSAGGAGTMSIGGAYDCPSCNAAAAAASLDISVAGSSSSTQMLQQLQPFPVPADAIATSPCDMCSSTATIGRPLAAVSYGVGGADNERVWQSPYARLPVCETGNGFMGTLQQQQRRVGGRHFIDDSGSAVLMTQIDSPTMTSYHPDRAATMTSTVDSCTVSTAVTFQKGVVHCLTDQRTSGSGTVASDAMTSSTRFGRDLTMSS